MNGLLRKQLWSMQALIFKHSFFAEDIIKYIFVNEQLCIFIRISLKFIHNGPVSPNQALVQVLAWRRTGDKPSPETMHIYMRH